MRSVPAYERDPYLTRIETEVVEVGVDGGRPFAVLADTVFYPEGGGQPCDRGTIGAAEVLDVRAHAGAVRHALDRDVAVGPVVAEIDWARRFDHMQQHTGQHLLTAVAEDRFSWATTAFHLGERACDIELAIASISPARLTALEEALAAEVRAARPVAARRVAPEEYVTLAVRSRGLPAGHTGDVRLVEIAGLDLNTCGGTHLRSTAEIEAGALLGTEPMRGGTRLFWVAGGRVRARMAAHEARAAALRVILGAPDEELASVAELKLGQLQELEKRARALEDELAEATALALAARPGPVVDAHFDGREIAYLQRVARRFAALAPRGAALLTASAAGLSSFAVVVGEEVALDAQAAGREIAAPLDGRGGGSGRMFQGKAGSLAGRGAALERLRALVGGA